MTIQKCKVCGRLIGTRKPNKSNLCSSCLHIQDSRQKSERVKLERIRNKIREYKKR